MTRCYKTLDNIDCLERGNLNLIRRIIMILQNEMIIIIIYMLYETQTVFVLIGFSFFTTSTKLSLSSNFISNQAPH